MIWVCPITPQNVEITPATAVTAGSKPKSGRLMKKGTFDIGPNHA